MTRNITLAVDEEVLAKYRVLAAEQRTTVNALVRKHMEEATGLAARRKAARVWMVEQINQNIARDASRTEPVESDEAFRWNREDIYSGPRFDWPRRR